MRSILAWGATLAFLAGSAFAAEPVEIKIGYLRGPPIKTKLSLMDVPAEDEGVAGARLGLDDDNTTGRFLDQTFSIVEKRLKAGEDPVAAATALADQHAQLLLVDLDADSLLKVADAMKGKGGLVFNISAIDDRLREEDCRAGVVHVAPARTMLADALAQYLVWKKWRKWLLVFGSHDKDKALADAYRRAAKRFGAKIVEEREFKDTGGARRTDSGIVELQRQIPGFLQGAADHDVVITADESEVFAGYVPYRTWDPRPVAGSAGLTATTWNPAFDQWGAVQLQNRFIKINRRFMTPLDLQAWTAIRMIGEGAAHAGSGEPAVIAGYVKGPEFSVAGFKGQKLTLREWNGQLRQPILLFDGRNTVSVSPQEGFLHQFTELDTLGLDRPETKCKL